MLDESCAQRARGTRPGADARARPRISHGGRCRPYRQSDTSDREHELSQGGRRSNRTAGDWSPDRGGGERRDGLGAACGGRSTRDARDGAERRAQRTMLRVARTDGECASSSSHESAPRGGGG